MARSFLSSHAAPPRAPWLQGVLDIGGPALGTVAVGLVTGVAMANSGLPLPVVLAISLLVFSSAPQLACLPLILAGAPVWVIFAAACVLNMRFVVFSAYWRPYFAHLARGPRVGLAYLAGDPILAAVLRRYPEPAPGQIGFFLGAALTNWAAWQVASLVGLFMADAIPLDWGLQFLGVLALFALALPMVVDRRTALSATVAALVAVASAALPYGLNVLAALAAGVAVGVYLDRRHAARRAPR
ncbi:MAG: AzlC family ABC transporter permease [Comamonas sp.]